MLCEEQRLQSTALLRLRVTAEADPAALARVIERFQNLNVLPNRFIAESGSTGVLHIQVDVCGISEERLTLIAARLSQCACILTVHWHFV
jgi:hypothetical protein